MATKTPTGIPEPVINEATQLLTNALIVLKPYLIALRPMERRDMSKMSDKTLPFVEKTIAYCESAPQFAPAFMNVEQLNVDFEVYNQLIPLLRLSRQLTSGLDDTSMKIGSGCFNNALTYYNLAKLGSRMDVPGAKTIYDDLRKRFYRTYTNGEKDIENPETDE